MIWIFFVIAKAMLKKEESRKKKRGKRKKVKRSEVFQYGRMLYR